MTEMPWPNEDAETNEMLRAFLMLLGAARGVKEAKVKPRWLRNLLEERHDIARAAYYAWLNRKAQVGGD